MELKNGPAGMPGIPVVSHGHNGLSRGETVTMACRSRGRGRTHFPGSIKTRRDKRGRQRLVVSIRGKSMRAS